MVLPTLPPPPQRPPALPPMLRLAGEAMTPRTPPPPATTGAPNWPDAACRHQPQWGRWENLTTLALTTAAHPGNREWRHTLAYEAADPALAHCDTCPRRGACHTWADHEAYDGIAAGAVWQHGRPLPRPADTQGAA